MPGPPPRDRSVFDDRQRAEGFGTDAQAYDRYRPSYPQALIRWLSIDDVGNALDIGCGTGQVARLLSAAGWNVTGLEPDSRMAAVAIDRGLKVDTVRFEAWEPDRAYDLVCSGQSWHWIDPDVGYDKAAAALRPGGRLALFWNFYRYDAPVLATIRATFERHAPQLWTGSVHLGNAVPHDVVAKDDLRARLYRHFEPPEWLTFTHRRRVTVDDWVSEARTHSPIAKLDEDCRDALLNDLSARLAEHAATVNVHHETSLVTACRNQVRPDG